MKVKAQIIGFKEVRKLIKAHPQIAKKATIREGELLAKRLIDFIVRYWRHHKKTGGMERGNTWQGMIRGLRLSWEVFNQVFYSRFINTGRREVRPVRKQWLRWTQNGRVIFAKRSRATQPSPAYDIAYKRFVLGWLIRLKNRIARDFRKAGSL